MEAMCFLYGVYKATWPVFLDYTAIQRKKNFCIALVNRLELRISIKTAYT